VGKKLSPEQVQLAMDVYNKIIEQKTSLTAYLDEILEAADPNTKLDAYERMLKYCGIQTRSILGGRQADKVQAFFRTSVSEVLFPEFVSRQVREAITNDTMLPYLIGKRTTIDSDSYKSFYVDDQPAKQHKVRVGEAAELPTSKIVGREQNIQLWKYGRAIDYSYEFVKMIQIDMLALFIRRIAMQTAKDKVYDVLDVIESGDGNDNAAPTYNLTTLDTGASAGTLTAKGFLKFLMQFEVFPCDTLIADQDTYIDLVLTNTTGVTIANLIWILAQGNAGGFSIASPQMPNKSLRLFWHTDVTAQDLIGINSQNAIEEVTLAGSDLSESQRFIKRQVETLTVSEINGYAKLFKEATGILKINA
jgi:hypothetical protein